MAPSENAIVDQLSTKKRNLDSASVSGSSTSDESTRKKKRRDRKNGKRRATIDVDGLGVPINGGARPSAFEKRRNSLGKAARDPRDEPPTKKRITVPGKGTVTRSPSPVIDFDGLSRPSMFRYPPSHSI